eukprot:g5008.t1
MQRVYFSTQERQEPWIEGVPQRESKLSNLKILQRQVDGTYLTEEAAYKDTRKKLKDAWTLDPSTYTSTEFHKVEQERIFGTAWTVVGLVDKVRNAGDTICGNLGKSPIFITRDKKGNLNGFHNVCRHRGSLLVLEDGKYPVISCPYHRWGYSLDGRLLATPMWDMGPKTKPKLSKRKGKRGAVAHSDIEKWSTLGSEVASEDSLSAKDIDQSEALAESPPSCDQLREIERAMAPTTKDFDKKDYPLFKIRVETWGPYVFATDCEETPDLVQCLGDMVDHLAEYPLDELVVARSKTFAPEANWKLLMENFMEYYHLPAVHPELCLVSGVEEHSRRQGKGMNVGFVTYPMTRGGTPIDPGILPPLPGLEGPNAETAWFHAIFPNTFYFLMP